MINRSYHYRNIFTKELLEKEYNTNRLSINKIAKKYGCGFETIRYHLHKFGIKVRSQADGTRMFTTTEEFSKHRSELTKGENNPMFGKTNKWGNHTIEAKEMIRESQLGRNNSMFGKSPCWKKIKYKGIWMRSTWEVKYAKYLDKKNIKWQYEPETFDLGKVSYTPDFYLSKTNTYIEIKGYLRSKDKIRMNLFKLNHKLEILYQKKLKQLGVL